MSEYQEESQLQNQESQFQQEQNQIVKKKKQIQKEKEKPKKAGKGKPATVKNQKRIKQKIPAKQKQPKKEKVIHLYDPLTILTNEQYTKLLQCKDVPLFSLNFQTQLIKILDVHDGDTFTGAIILHNQLKKYKLRLDEIDAAQLHDPNPQIKQFSQKVRDLLAKLKGTIVKGELGKFDKYGRLLTKIYLNTDIGDLDLSKWLIEQKLVKSYGGKTKNVFTVEDYKAVKDMLQTLSLPKWKNY